MVKHYLVITIFLFVCPVKGMSSNSLKKSAKTESRYLKLFNDKEFSKSSIERFFSKYSGFYGGDCYNFNLAVKLVLDRDCKRCLHELLDIYDTSEAFLTCRSHANKKTIIHHLFENVTNDDYAQCFKDTHRILTFHNSLAKTVDKDGNLPRVPQNVLAPLETEMLNNLLVQYYKPDIVPKSLLAYFLAHKKVKEAQEIVSSYDPKKQSFLGDVFDTKTYMTYMHIIVSHMQRDNFVIYIDVLSALCALYPKLAYQTDKTGLTPLGYLNSQILSQPVTDDQMKCLKKLLDKASEKKFSLWTLFKKQ